MEHHVDSNLNDLIISTNGPYLYNIHKQQTTFAKV
jgi:hypothetical protein